MIRRPRLLLLPDVRNWAFHTTANTIAEHCADIFDIDIYFTHEKPTLHGPYDIIHVFYPFETHHRNFDIGNAKSIDLVIGKENIIYNISTRKIATTLWYNGTLLEVNLKPINKQVRIRVLVDHSIIEIIGNNGQVYITKDHHHYNNISNIKTFVRGGKAEIISFIVHELNSIWENIND